MGKRLWVIALLAALALTARWGLQAHREAQRLQERLDVVYLRWLEGFDPARGTGPLRAYLKRPDPRYLEESLTILLVDANEAAVVFTQLYGPDVGAVAPFVRAREVIRLARDPAVSPVRRTEALQTVIAAMEELGLSLRRAAAQDPTALRPAEEMERYVAQVFAGAASRLDRALSAMRQ